MGNLCFLRSNSSRFGLAFRACLPEAATRFGDACMIKDESPVCVSARLYAPDGQEIAGVHFYVKQKKVEFKPSLDGIISRWFDLWIATKAATIAMHAIRSRVWMEDEGLGREQLAIDYHYIYKRASDWRNEGWQRYLKKHGELPDFAEHYPWLTTMRDILDPVDAPIRLIPS